MINAKPTTPPITPPIIAPLFVFLLPPLLGAAVADGVPMLFVEENDFAVPEEEDTVDEGVVETAK